VIGTLVGSVIGATRNRLVQYVGEVAIEGINAFPTLIVVIALVAAFGTGATSILAALFITAWARYAKVARARARVVRDLGYIDVARGLGFPWPRILVFHIAPNVYPVAVAYAISHFVEVVLAIAALSFLGAGVQPPTPEWGVMMSDGRIYLAQAWWMVLFPGILLSVTAIGVSLLASDQTSDAFTVAAK
jgi:peptide/nickel transport system permease protein